MAIGTYKDKRTERLAHRKHDKSVARDIAQRAYLKLQMIEAAMQLSDLRVPPGNQLEVLHGNRAGQHSIRVNRQWRICFRWDDGQANDVEFCDYH